MSKKQEIYKEILELCLPELRNSLSGSFVFGRRRKDAFELSQLVHNLYVSILEPDFVEHDLWFLNVQAKEFFESSRSSVLYVPINELIKELFKQVPDNARIKLDWDGP
ncbi:zinc ABC transporter substrate-binding protein [Aliikangiella marina]|uniref:Zinc ABC transporter substrate-binding protein n=1 Tax=Aliikangiella marina TaxID=1712262 RepID=A0A545T9K4_9GAMM|nr:zinc ABC transporter substrate-binding protein [Aliikangiella marina]TQV73892.1 zinc ABC transporter substrate-binding protein [Aliikangiella marina]